jgi:uncharacterized protein
MGSARTAQEQSMRQVYVFLACLALPPGTEARAQAPAPPPQVVVTGRGEVTLAPDEATVVLAMETHAGSAAAAGAQNAQRIRAIRDALVRLGIPADSIATIGYSVSPDYQGGRDRPNGYIAANTLRVKTRRVDQLGEIVDAALAAGANRVGYVQFGSSRTAEARRAALAQAIAEARLDAEAMARAGGGALGPLLELNTVNLARGDVPVALQGVRIRGAASAETPITPTDINVQVSVTARWSFVGR